jgi:TPR repeat protein
MNVTIGLEMAKDERKAFEYFQKSADIDDTHEML